MSRCFAVRLGLTDFAWTEALQQELVRARIQGRAPDVILLTSHRPVITIGRSGGLEDLLRSGDELHARGIAVCGTRRGGRATYHGPGQLIVYPILNLKRLRRDVHWYITALENATVALLAELGVEAVGAKTQRGVWVGNRKVASIGIAVRRWVTSHGLALNVADELAGFALIVPCGLRGVEITSVERETGCIPDRHALEERLLRHLGEALGIDVELCPRQWLARIVTGGTKARTETIVTAYGGPGLG